jgi:hypothetical protein
MAAINANFLGIKLTYETREITIDDVLDAIEKNGLEQTFGSFFKTEGEDYVNNPPKSGKIIGACALGQAALNLGVNNFSLTDTLNLALPNTRLGQRIIKMNDHKKRSFAHIANYYRTRLSKKDRSTKILVRV